MKRDIIKVIESRKGHLDDRVRRDYIRNGIATIPCQISSYSDLISPYSVKGQFETLNPDLIDYLKEAAELTPDECPLVLNIIGDCLSQEEKKSIEELILDDAAYNLGRLASMKVVFSDEYEEPNYMDGDADRLYSEIEKDVMETIKEELKGEL